MTDEQKESLLNVAKIVGLGLSLAFSAGAAKHSLDGKEDRAEHAADVRAIDARVLEESNARLLQHVHDSALVSVLLDRVNDISCAQDPRRSYCR